MKKLVWIVFGLLLALWSGTLWVAAEFTRWAGAFIGSGQAVDWAAMASGWKLPAWLAWWVDPSLIESTMSTAVWALEAARDALPWLETATGWLVALAWVVWGFGALALLLVTLGAHALVSRRLVPHPAGA